MMAGCHIIPSWKNGPICRLIRLELEVVMATSSETRHSKKFSNMMVVLLGMVCVEKALQQSIKGDRFVMTMTTIFQWP